MLCLTLRGCNLLHKKVLINENTFNTMKITRFLMVIVMLFTGRVTAEACTAAVISGKATPDGRPMIWKHRDSNYPQNAIRYFGDGKYASIGLINSADKEGEAIWAGYNSAGFAIINTASYNLLALDDTIDLKDREGILMRQALQQCATVEEFEEFLKKAPKPLGVEANFGVIDARGGAAWFETDHFTFTKLDVTDPSIAPQGYLVHTNFSFTGDPSRGAGHIRFNTAQNLFFQASQQGNLTVRWILQEASRSLWHSLTGVDLEQSDLQAGTQHFVHFTDFIPRHSSSSSVVIQGVTPGEEVALTTMWTILGFPLTSVTFPLWLEGGQQQPSLVTTDENGVAPLCEKSLKLKERLFPIQQNYGGNYIDVTSLVNRNGTGILQQLKPLEDEIFERSFRKQEAWRKNKERSCEIPAFTNELNELITERYLTMFGL